MASSGDTSGAPVEITRYPNRRLYDRSRAQYVTLSEIEERVRSGETVVVRDSKTGEDLTRAVLVQILLERHPERMDLFPAALLHLVLRANDLALDWLRAYLRQSLVILESLPGAPLSPLPSLPPFLAPPAVPPLAPTLPNPMAISMEWMKALVPGWVDPSEQSAEPASSTVTPTTPPPPDAPPLSAAVAAEAPAAEGLAERLAELERRLRELEQRPSP